MQMKSPQKLENAHKDMGEAVSNVLVCLMIQAFMLMHKTTKTVYNIILLITMKNISRKIKATQILNKVSQSLHGTKIST